ncbi:luciferin 4-monooxygenase-like [Drosophila subobscura]|uniref:luciferin 4-monooxygenase-like n=1 Tax=Drosophila subobscura TaxID=7241 RepID=UPI00155B1F8B|nr:luciferin 4-monooxygenase-like [Drosophila subobscura]
MATTSGYDPVTKIWSCEEQRSQFGEDLSMGELIFQEMKRHPKDIAQISDSEKTILLREELLMNAMRIASYLRNLGLEQSDVVGIIARNTTHISAVAYACFFNGIAPHSLNIAYLPEIIEKLYNITKPRIVFCDGDEYEKVREATAKLDVKIVTMRNHPTNSIRIQDVLQTPVEEGFQPARLKLGNSQQMFILSSSGTTGTPKAITMSNCHKLLNGLNMLTTADVQYAASTLDWASGIAAAISAGVFSTKRIISERAFDPADTLRIIEEYKVTWMMQAPSHVAAIVGCPAIEVADLQSLRYFMYTGGRCTLETQLALRRRLGRDCLNFGYGFSELGCFCAVNWKFDEKPNSVGRLTSGLKVKILNESGDTVGPNEVGEVCVNTGAHWPGYYGSPEATKQVYDEDNWIHSGDLGCMDDDGFLYIVDRKKDLLKYQSNKYYPHELEELISQMPAVADVCAFGIWTETNGDEAAAAVVKKPSEQLTEQDVVEHVARHAKTGFLRLHAGALIVEQLQRSANGKTNRMATKQHFLQAKGI